MSLIIEYENEPFLFLGSMDNASNESYLKKHKITHILNCTDEIKNYFENDSTFTYLKIKLDDSEEEDIYKHFEKAHKFFSMEGISRSSTIVISYIMKEHGSNFIDSFDLVRKKRDIIYPNNGFLKLLLEYEKEIHGKNSISYREVIVDRVSEYYQDIDKNYIEKSYIELEENYYRLISHLERLNQKNQSLK